MPVRGGNLPPGNEALIGAHGAEPLTRRLAGDALIPAVDEETVPVMVTTLLGRLVEVRVRFPFVSSLPVKSMSCVAAKQVFVRKIPVMFAPCPLRAPV